MYRSLRGRSRRGVSRSPRASGAAARVVRAARADARRLKAPVTSGSRRAGACRCEGFAFALVESENIAVTDMYV